MHDVKLTMYGLLCALLISCGEFERPAPPPLEIPVFEVIQQDVPIIIELVGQTLGSSDIPIRARVDGTLESIEFLEGRVVQKDQLLYTIETRPYDAKVVEAKGYLAEAKTARTKAKSDLDRIRPLAEINAVSQQDLDSAVAQFHAAEGSVQAAAAQVEQALIELGYTKIYSPIDGRIGLTRAKVGEYVGKDPNPIVLNYVSQTDPIRVRFSINERQFLEFARKFTDTIKRNDEEAETEAKVETESSLEMILADGSIHAYKGRVRSYEAAIDPTTGTLTLEADFPNPDTHVLAGQFARIRALVEVRENTLLVPQRAVSELQGNFQVMVIGQDNVVEVRKVKTGPVHDNLLVIEEGLKAGERVATEGLLRLRNGMKVIPKDWASTQSNKENLTSNAASENGE